MMPVTYHATRCPRCDSDLTVPGSVVVHLLDEDEDGDTHRWTEKAEVDAGSGALSDPNGYIEDGFHAGSECEACGEQLDELEPDDA